MKTYPIENLFCFLGKFCVFFEDYSKKMVGDDRAFSF